MQQQLRRLQLLQHLRQELHQQKDLRQELQQQQQQHHIFQQRRMVCILDEIIFLLKSVEKNPAHWGMPFFSTTGTLLVIEF